MENKQLFRLGSQDNEWTQRQIDAFMDNMEDEMFDGDMRRGGSGGSIVELVREDSDGNRTRYVKEDGEWSEE